MIHREPATDWVIADASWGWTDALFSRVAGPGRDVLLLKVLDWRNALAQRVPPRRWTGRLDRRGDHLWESHAALPPGWMKSYPRVGMAPLAGIVHLWRRRDGRGSGRRLILVASYPYYTALRDMIRPESLIYYNMDDYALYWPDRAEEVRERERVIVRAADLSAFCARARADELAEAVPEAAERIIHLPHGAPEAAIPDRPCHRPGPAPEDIAGLPRPLLGFVGSLEDRVDWRLVDRLASEFPGGSVVLVGRDPTPAPGLPWYEGFLRAVARPNVHRLGWKTQGEIGRYNAAWDVALIPYAVDHPFNRASCPTKIMDYMATTRPVVTTDLPECRLYDGLFAVADGHDAFVRAVRRIVDDGSDDGRAADRLAIARGWTWDDAAARLREELDRSASKPALSAGPRSL